MCAWGFLCVFRLLLPLLADMSGIIPEEDDEDVCMVYDDVGNIDDDIYEELPGVTKSVHLFDLILLFIYFF